MRRLAHVVLLIAACGTRPSGSGNPVLTSPEAIQGYLAGSHWLMAGTDIPQFPNGYFEGLNLGVGTQCYHSIAIAVGSAWTVTGVPGTLNGAPPIGSDGTCDRTTASGAGVAQATSSVLISGVRGNADCFDLRLAFVDGLVQNGRGKLSPDGTVMTLELFIDAGTLTFGGYHCADGNVGSSSATFDGGSGVTPFTWNAQQVFRLQRP
jgi:hypothetical protein